MCLWPPTTTLIALRLLKARLKLAKKKWICWRYGISRDGIPQTPGGNGTVRYATFLCGTVRYGRKNDLLSSGTVRYGTLFYQYRPSLTETTTDNWTASLAFSASTDGKKTKTKTSRLIRFNNNPSSVRTSNSSFTQLPPRTIATAIQPQPWNPSPLHSTHSTEQDPNHQHRYGFPTSSTSLVNNSL